MKPLFEDEPPMFARTVVGEDLNRVKKRTLAEASVRSTLVRRVGPSDIEFLSDDFSLVCSTDGTKNNSVLSKLSNLFNSNDPPITNVEKEHQALFYGEKKKPSKITSIFGNSEPLKSKFPALEAAAADARDADFFKKTTESLTDNVLQSMYKDHPLIKGRPDSFALMVQKIDTKIHLDSAITIIHFGEPIQVQIGKFLEKSSGYGTQLTSIGLSDSIDQMIQIMGELAVNKFTGKKKTGFFSSSEYTVADFMKAYDDAVVKLNSLIDGLVKQSATIINMMSSCEGMVDQHDKLVDELDAYIIAGKILLERNANKAFKDSNEMFLDEQFQARILSLSTYENLCIVSFEQVKMLQRNLINMAINAQNIATVTYPLWKTSVSTLLSRWQNSGNMKKDATIPSLMNDSEFVAITSQTEKIITDLNTKG